MEDADSFLQQPRGATQSFGHWLLSWYADDFVAGAPPETQQSMWNIRENWNNEYSFIGPYPLPDFRLTSSTPAVAFKLGAPDARYVELDASAGMALDVTRSGTLVGEFGLMLMRVR